MAAGRRGCRTSSSRRVRRLRRESPPRARAGRGDRRPKAHSGRPRSRAPGCRWPAKEDRSASMLRARGRPGTVRPSGPRRRCRARRGYRRSRRGGNRPDRGSPAADCQRRAGAMPARAAPPSHAPARPGCSRRRGSRRCTAAGGRRRPVCAPARARCSHGRAQGPAARRDRGEARSRSPSCLDDHRGRVTGLQRPRMRTFY